MDELGSTKLSFQRQNGFMISITTFYIYVINVIIDAKANFNINTFLFK